MKFAQRALVPLGAVGLVLAGCSGAETADTAPAAPVAETVTVTQPAPAAETVTVEAAPSTAEPPQAAESVREPDAALPTGDTPPTGEEDGAPQAADDELIVDGEFNFGESTTNDRGNLVKDIGQWAGIANEGGDITVAFRVTDIRTDYECEEPRADPSVNGQFVALDFEIQTQPALGLADDPYDSSFFFNQASFIVFDEDNNRENDSMGSGYSCVPMDQSLSGAYGPNEKVSGLVVLDTAVRSGSIVLDGVDYGIDGGSGWAWEF